MILLAETTYNMFGSGMGWDEIFETWDGMGWKMIWDGMRIFETWDGMECGMIPQKKYRFLDGISHLTALLTTKVFLAGQK